MQHKARELLTDLAGVDRPVRPVGLSRQLDLVEDACAGDLRRMAVPTEAAVRCAAALAEAAGSQLGLHPAALHPASTRGRTGHRMAPPARLGDEHFRASLHAAQVGRVQMAVITAEPHSVARTRRHIASDAPDLLQLTLQLSGQGVLTQKDRQAQVRPGEMVVYDPRSPFTYDLRQSHTGLVLMFPRAMLRITERDLARVTATPVPCRDGLGKVVQPLLYGLARPMGHPTTWSA